MIELTIKEQAIAQHEIMLSYVEAGFTRIESQYLLAEMLKGARP